MPLPPAPQPRMPCKELEEGGRLGKRGKGEQGELSQMHRHRERESRQSLVEDGTACLALVIAAGWLLPVEGSPASSADRGHRGKGTGER